MPNKATLQIEIEYSEKGGFTIKDLGSEAEKQGKKVKKGLSPIGKIFDEIGDKIRSFGPLIASYFGTQAVSGVISLADEMSTLSGRIDSITDSSEEYNALSKLIYEQAQETGTQLQANISSVTGLAIGLKDLNIANSEVLAINEAVNKSLIASNSTQEQATSFQLQFVQAMQSGVVQGDEFRAMMESNSVFAQQLAKALDTNIAGLREMSKEGQLTTEVIRKAIPEMADNINASFAEIPLTISRARTQISNAFAQIISEGNQVGEGTNAIAEDISGLADVVEQNTPAIQAMFSVVVSGAEVAVKGISGLEGTFKAVDAVVLGVSGRVFDMVGYVTQLTDAVGITDNATAEWKTNSEAAIAAANDLAEQSNQAFQRMYGNVEKNTEAEKAYKAELEKNLASIEADKTAQQTRATVTADSIKSLISGIGDAVTAEDKYKAALAANAAIIESDKQAQSERSASVVSSINKISDAEKKAAKEREQTVTSMWQTLGVGGDEYFRNEAQKILDQATKWEQAGADAVALEQYKYEQINALSQEAWSAEEASAGKYLDGLTSTFTSAVEDISAGIGMVNEQEIYVPADVYTEPAAQGIAYVDSEVSRLSAEDVVIPIDADNSAALSSIAEVNDSISSMQSMLESAMGGVGGGQVAMTVDEILSPSSGVLGNKGLYRAAKYAYEHDKESFRYRNQEYNVSDFYGYANGGIMTASGPVDLKKYAYGGIANSPQIALFGEGSMPEAYVPLPDGRSIPVTMSGGAQSAQQVTNVVNNDNRSTVVINVTQSFSPNQVNTLVEQQRIKAKRTIS